MPKQDEDRYVIKGILHGSSLIVSPCDRLEKTLRDMCWLSGCTVDEYHFGEIGSWWFFNKTTSIYFEVSGTEKQAKSFHQRMAKYQGEI